MNLFIKWVIMVTAILASSYILPGATVTSVWTAVWLSVFLGVINLTLKPILVVLTLPINILTLGLFTFVINALMILLASSVIKGFSVVGFWQAMLFGIVLSVISYLLSQLFKIF